jgi:hypothetical protein
MVGDPREARDLADTDGPDGSFAAVVESAPVPTVLETAVVDAVALVARAFDESPAGGLIGGIVGIVGNRAGDDLSTLRHVRRILDFEGFQTDDIDALIRDYEAKALEATGRLA